LSEIKSIHTSCKDCAFAQYYCSTQTGCDFNRISKFKEVREAYDNEKNFYIINGRQCNYFTSKDKYPGKNKEELIELVVKKHKVQLTLFVYIDDESKLLEIADSIIEQDLQPHEVYFVDINKIGPKLNLLLNKKIGNKLNWRIIYPVEDFNIGEIPEFILQKSKGLFSVFLSSYQKIKYNWISNIDNMINQELKQLCLITPIGDGISCFTTMPNLIRHSGIYSFKEFVEFIQEEAEKDNKQEMIINGNQL